MFIFKIKVLVRITVFKLTLVLWYDNLLITADEFIVTLTILKHQSVWLLSYTNSALVGLIRSIKLKPCVASYEKVRDLFYKSLYKRPIFRKKSNSVSPTLCVGSALTNPCVLLKHFIFIFYFCLTASLLNMFLAYFCNCAMINCTPVNLHWTDFLFLWKSTAISFSLRSINSILIHILQVYALIILIIWLVV